MPDNLLFCNGSRHARGGHFSIWIAEFNHSSLPEADILRLLHENQACQNLTSHQYLAYKLFSRHCDTCKDFRLKIPAIYNATDDLGGAAVRIISHPEVLA
jgi:hypothetical protein